MLAKRVWTLLFLAIAAFYLYGLSALPLVGPDEPRYAEVAREMLARRDLITPTLGGLPWFEKPPLLYWMMMASYRVFGVTEFAARLGPAICGLLAAIFVYWAAAGVRSPSAKEGSVEVEQASRREFARWSTLVFLSSLGVIAFSFAATHDIVLTMTITGALACFFAWSARIGSARIPACGSPASMPAVEVWLLIACYFFIGLSLLAKGLIGIVIPFGVIAVYFLLRRESPSRRFWLSILWGIPLAFAVAAVWYGPMIYRHGWTFVDQFIIQHHFARFATNKYHHPAPFYFYLLVLAGLALPWTIVLIAALISSRQWNWRGETALDRLRVFALAWIVVPVIFFSFSGSKLTAYILPVMPAVALLVGERLTCFLHAGHGDKVIRLTGTLMILLSAVGAWYASHRFTLGFGCVIGTISPLVLTGGGALLRPRMRQPLFLFIPLATFATAAIAGVCAASIVERPHTVRDLLAVANARGYESTRVVQLHTNERTAEFYAAGRLDYRSDGEPIVFDGAMYVADAAQRVGGPVLCFVPTEYESQLTTYKQVQVEVLGNNGRVSLLVVRLR